jgi:hypothetical protein
MAVRASTPKKGLVDIYLEPPVWKWNIHSLLNCWNQLIWNLEAGVGSEQVPMRRLPTSKKVIVIGNFVINKSPIF